MIQTFLTGSRKYNTAGAMSDWDYVIHERDLKKAQSHLEYMDYHLLGRNENSSYGCPSEHWFNRSALKEDINLVITTSNIMFGRWAVATKVVEKVIFDFGFIKQGYIPIFNTIRNLDILPLEDDIKEMLVDFEEVLNVR